MLHESCKLFSVLQVLGHFRPIHFRFFLAFSPVVGSVQSTKVSANLWLRVCVRLGQWQYTINNRAIYDWCVCFPAVQFVWLKNPECMKFISGYSSYQFYLTIWQTTESLLAFSVLFLVAGLLCSFPGFPEDYKVLELLVVRVFPAG